MLRYTLVRLAWLLVVWLCLSLLVFGLAALVPGDPATALLGPHATEARVKELTDALNLDGSFFERYLRWLSGVLRGDLGHAYSLQRPVADVVFERLGPTLLLGATALGLGTALGLVAGMVSASRRGRRDEIVIRGATLLGISTPSFVLAIAIMFTLCVGAGWFPVSGMQSALPTGEPRFLDVLRHLAMPATTLALICAGVIARLTRRYALDALEEDWVQVSRSQGLSERQVLYDRVFRVVLVRIMPLLGLQAGFVLGGAVYVETVFQWPGLGRLLVSAIEKRDLLLAQGAVLVLATTYVLSSLGSDLAQRALDPRVAA